MSERTYDFYCDTEAAVKATQDMLLDLSQEQAKTFHQYMCNFMLQHPTITISQAVPQILLLMGVRNER